MLFNILLSIYQTFLKSLKIVKMKNHNRQITSFSESCKVRTQEMWTISRGTWVPRGARSESTLNKASLLRGPLESHCVRSPHPHTTAGLPKPHTTDIWGSFFVVGAVLLTAERLLGVSLASTNYRHHHPPGQLWHQKCLRHCQKVTIRPGNKIIPT